MNPKAGKKAMLFVLITVMISSVNFGIVIPVLPDLLRELTTIPDHKIALHMAGLTFVFAVMQFICMPIIGGLSDRYGRRPIMLLSLVGLGIDYFIMGFAPMIGILYLGRVIAGGFAATFSTANAYIADISPPETRAQNFALVGAAFGVGFMLGPAIGGILGDETKFLGELAGPRVPFIAAGCIAMLNVLFGLFVLPETLDKENRRAFDIKRSNPIGALISLGRVRGAIGLIGVMFVLALAHTVYPTTYTLSTEVKLGWEPGDVGLSLLAFGAASIVVQGGLIRLIIPRTGLFLAGIFGVICAFISYLVLGLANVGWMVYLSGLFAAFAGLAGPAINNMMSSRIGKSEQGELQGAIGAAQGLALMAGPLMMGGTFFVFAKEGFQFYQPGAPFLLAAIMAAIGFIIYLLVTDKKDRTAKMPSGDDVVETAE